MTPRDDHDPDPSDRAVCRARPTFPTAGTITRLMQATITLSGKAPVTRSRMEVVTFKNDGTATVVITKNGTTKNCTLSAATGLKCS